MERISLYKHHDKGMFDFLNDLINLIYYETNCNRTLIELSLSFYLSTEVTWNPHPPAPSPAREREQNPYYFLIPLSCERVARGEGYRNFHVAPLIKT